jgi:hypothetical protein
MLKINQMPTQKTSTADPRDDSPRLAPIPSDVLPSNPTYMVPDSPGSPLQPWRWRQYASPKRLAYTNQSTQQFNSKAHHNCHRRENEISRVNCI